MDKEKVHIPEEYTKEQMEMLADLDITMGGVTDKGRQLIEMYFSLEENIHHYDLKYEDNKDSLSIDRAYDGLLKSIYFHMKKIIRDHCE